MQYPNYLYAIFDTIVIKISVKMTLYYQTEGLLVAKVAGKHS